MSPILSTFYFYSACFHSKQQYIIPLDLIFERICMLVTYYGVPFLVRLLGLAKIRIRDDVYIT